ncbi:MAG: TolC family protein [Labilithrix sp.]|nr:TolC family protein [Labilithrix sp.]
MRRTLLCSALLVVSFLGRTALAQPAPPAAQQAEPVPPSVQLPPEPPVDDPMLATVARPRVEIGTWEEALRHVRARSTDLRIAAQEILRAEAQSRIALAGALTTLNGQATYTHNIITNSTLQPVRSGDGLGFRPVNTPFPDFVNGSLVASQPVFALRSWYAIGTAERNENVAHLSLEDTKRLIALNVANSIVAVVTAERVAELNRLGLRNALTRLELAVRRSTLGSGTGLDVVRARQDVETARATLVAGDESLRQSREALGLALGIPEQVGVPPNVDLNGLEASARTTCKVAPTIDDRPDVAALHERTEVARRLVNDAKYQFAPTIDVRSTVGTTTIDTGAAPNTTWNVQAVLTVPIWDGGVRYGNLRDTRAQEVIAGQRLEAARRQATIEVTQARRGVSVAEDRRRVAAETRDLAAENDRLTRTAYLEGRGTSLELVTAAQALREAEIQLAVRDFELVRARVLAILALASCPW